MDPQTYLRVLTFVGLIVGTMGGLFSQLTRTSVDVDGTTRKRLTAAGKWALAISLLGFAGSFSSELLKSSIQAQEKAQAQFATNLQKERERQDDLWKSRSSELAQNIFQKTTSALQTSEKNLTETIAGFEREQNNIAESRERVLSDNLMHETRLYGRLSDTGTPLTTMTIKLTIDNVPAAIRQKILQGSRTAEASTSEPDYQDLADHHNTGPEDDVALVQSVMDQKVIQPLINWVGADQFDPELNWKDEKKSAQAQGILAFSLDKHFSALVCVGWVSKPDIFIKEQTPRDQPVTNSLLPSGVLIGDELEFFLSAYGPPSRSYKRTKVIRPLIRVSVVKNSLVLTIELTRASLDDSLIRYAQNSFTTASLADTVELFSWSPSNDGQEGTYGNPDLLPFDPVEVHSGIPSLDLEKDAESSQVPARLRRMRLQIIPNGIEKISKTYDLTFSSAGDIMEGPRDDYPRGYVRLWHGHAR